VFLESFRVIHFEPNAIAGRFGIRKRLYYRGEVRSMLFHL